MKLTKKLLLLIISASLAGALLAVSILAIWQMRSQSISMAVDNYDRQMDSISYVFLRLAPGKILRPWGISPLRRI